MNILLWLTLSCAHHLPPAPTGTPLADETAARAVFEANIAAIQARDREAYLACYAPTERLVRAGPEGPLLGFSELAEGTPATGSDDWPERLEADDLQVHWLAPGVVYGSYRYRVTIDGEMTEGLSERVFLRQPDGTWLVAVSTAFGDPAP